MSVYVDILSKYAVSIALIFAINGCSPDRIAVTSPASVEIEPASKKSNRSTAEAVGSAEEPRVLFEGEASGVQGGRLTKPVVERGSGLVVGQPRRPEDIGVSRDEAGDVVLNVVDADIRDVARLILEDGLDANYIIDPAVTGKITVRTSRPVPADDVIATLGSVLALNGAALVEANGIYKIVPADQAASAGGRPASRTSARADKQRSGIQVAPLRYADAEQIAELLQPFVAAEGAIQIDSTRNAVLLVGSPDQIATMSDLIDMFDVDWMKGMSFGLYPLKVVGASQLADELDQIFGDPENGVVARGIRLVPLDRLSALMVIASQPDSLDRVEAWIKRLDKQGDGEGEQVYVYAVQNGRASDLASVLGALFDIESSAVGSDTLLAPGLEPIELRSSGFSFAASEERTVDGAEEDGARQSFGSRGGRQHVGKDSGPGRRSLTQGNAGSETRIVADETNNALLIRATAKEYKQIQSALRELDKQPLQVLLEATIAEVSLEDELSYGVQWFFGSGDSGVTFSDFADGAVGQVFPGFSGLLSRGDVRVVLNALDSVSEVNVISSPQILVLDNQTARLEVGDEVPVVTQQAEGFEADARIVNTVEQRQTGVILNVTPRVNASGLVVLDIQQEVSDVVRTTTSGIDSPTIAQRRIGTTVAVASNQTIVLGGLIQDDVGDLTSGVPLLKDIPGIGALFRNTTQVTSRTELLVMITPKVLTNQQEAVAATEELRRRLGSLEPLRSKVF